MNQHFKLFVAIVVLNMVRNSRADIVNCDYFDTVDISDLKRVNDTYLYNGIEISANRTGEYNYRELRDGSTELVKSHLRACACELIPCVRICCPRKNILANGKCNDGFIEEISLPMLNLTLNNKEVKVTPLSNLTEMVVIRDQYQSCDEMNSLSKDDYRMLKDEIDTFDMWPEELYCLHPQNNTDFPQPIWVAHQICTHGLPPGNFGILLISLICYILTLSVYIFVKKLRNVLGKCLICALSCSLFNILIYILDELNLINRICLLVGYSRYFSRMAYNLWLCVISFHLWKFLTSVDKNEPTSFVTYNAIAWGMAAFPTGVIYIANQVWDDLQQWIWWPHMGKFGCMVKVFVPPLWMHSYGPVLTLTIFKVIMFILTVIHIWKVKSELRKFKRGEGRTIQCFNFDTETYLMFLRFSVIMGSIWIVDFALFLKSYSFFEEVSYCIAYMERSFGIIVFIVLILRRSILKLLKERIQCSPRTTAGGWFLKLSNQLQIFYFQFIMCLFPSRHCHLELN